MFGEMGRHARLKRSEQRKGRGGQHEVETEERACVVRHAYWIAATGRIY